jgi:cyclic beta-1,2-glucan synthetase
MVTSAGRWLQPLARSAVTRWREDGDHATTGAASATSATWRAATSGRPPTSPRACAPPLRGDLLRGPRRVPPARSRRRRDAARSKPTPRSWSRRKTTSNCAREASPTARGIAGEIEVTSYAEVVMAPARPTPASGLQQSVRADRDRARAARHAVHAPSAFARTNRRLDVPCDGGARRGVGTVSYETDRARFIGRGRQRRRAAGAGGRPSALGTEGSVLDPIVAASAAHLAGPRQAATHRHGDRRGRPATWRSLWSRNIRTGISPTACSSSGGPTARSCCASSTRPRPTRSYTRAWPGRHLCPCLAARRCRSPRKNRRGQSGLWGYAISGDLPIVLLQIGDAANIHLVRQLVQAHAYWRLKGLAVDLVIWNEDQAGYPSSLQEQIMGLIRRASRPA